MKNLKYLVLSLFAATMLISCVDDDNDELTGGAATGGLVDAKNQLVSYVVQSGTTYTAKGSILQGASTTSEVNIYKSFNDVTTGATSNENLLTTIPVTTTQAGQTFDFEFGFTYEDLIEGLTLNGSPLPTDDAELTIGDFWTIRYESTTSTGDQFFNSASTKVSVGTRYAGVYNVIQGDYYRENAYQGSYVGSTPQVIIESVDATVYRHIGLAFWTDGNEFYFTVDPDTNVITVLPEYPAGTGTLLNSSPIMTCEGAGGPFETIPCDATTSVAIPDDITGADELLFTVGYFRGTGATREFFEHLVKVVE